MRNIFVYLGFLQKLIMFVVVVVEEDYLNFENEIYYIKDESIFIVQGLVCIWLCMLEGCIMRIIKRFLKKLKCWGSFADILKYLGKYFFEVKVILVFFVVEFGRDGFFIFY